MRVALLLILVLPGWCSADGLLGVSMNAGERVGRFPSVMSYRSSGSGPFGLGKRDRTYTYRTHREGDRTVVAVEVVDHLDHDAVTRATLGVTANGAVTYGGSDPAIINASNALALTPDLIGRIQGGEAVAVPGRIDARGLHAVTFVHRWDRQTGQVETTVAGDGVELTTHTAVDGHALPVSSETRGKVGGISISSKLTAAE